MKLTIQPLLPSEVDSFFPVFSNVLQKEFPIYSKNVVRYFLDKIYSKINFPYWIANNMKIVLTARDNEDIVGFAVIDEPYGGVSLCRWLGVIKEFQGKGAGSALMKKWIELAHSQGCHKVELAAQPQAKGFYEKQGLKIEGLRKLSYFGGDQYIFGKVIGEPQEEAIIK